MRDSDDSSIPSFRNAFTPNFLQRIGERDEPLTAAEADVAGPWSVEMMPGVGWGLFRAGEGAARQSRPFAVFRDRAVALLFAAVLPGTGRDKAFHLHKDAEGAGYAVEAGADGGVVGYFALFDETLVDAAHVVECLMRQPESLANLLEAAGGLALERAGAILDARVSGAGPESPPAVAATA
jgi:hypothetical protein